MKLTIVKNVFLSILRGRFIQTLHLENCFAQIVYTFFLFAMAIMLNLLIDSQLVKVEKNKAIISDLEILHAQRASEYQSLHRQSTVSLMLQQKGSTVASPTKPAKDLR